jgi:hypothetical protein
MAEDIRQMIRSILVEELASLNMNQSVDSKPPPREQIVSISSDRELTEFAHRLLDMARDSRTRADIESGRLVFCLKQGSASSPSSYISRSASDSTRGSLKQFEKGLITEKQILSMPEHVKVIKIGKSVRLTPLANDAVRQAGIKIEKVKS